MIYFIRELGSDYVKVGVSNDPHSRLTSLQIGNPRELYIEGLIEVPGADKNPDLDYEVERRIHNSLRHRGERGEWFTLPAYKSYVILDAYDATLKPEEPEALRFAREYLLGKM